MAVSAPDNNGSIKTGVLLVSFLVLAIVFIGAENTSRTTRTTDAQKQLAQALDASDFLPSEPNTTPPISTPIPDTTKTAAPTCTPERDEQQRKVCKRKAQETKNHMYQKK